MASSVRCYCAFCGSRRNVFTKRHITWLNVITSAFLSFLIMLFLWQKFEARVVMLFFVVLAVTEVVIVVRWRLSIMCHHCGFDPVLYLRNHDQAAKAVISHLEEKRKDPDFLITSSPFLTRPRRSSENVPSKKPVEIKKPAKLEADISII